MYNLIITACNSIQISFNILRQGVGRGGGNQLEKKNHVYYNLSCHSCSKPSKFNIFVCMQNTQWCVLLIIISY